MADLKPRGQSALAAATPEEIDADLRSADPDVRLAAGMAAVGDAWIAFRSAKPL